MLSTTLIDQETVSDKNQHTQGVRSPGPSLKAIEIDVITAS